MKKKWYAIISKEFNDIIYDTWFVVDEKYITNKKRTIYKGFEIKENALYYRDKANVILKELAKEKIIINEKICLLIMMALVNGYDIDWIIENKNKKILPKKNKPKQLCFEEL